MMPCCQHLQNLKSNLLLMFLHLPDVGVLVILENVNNSSGFSTAICYQPWKQCDLIVAERDIVQQLILEPC